MSFINVEFDLIIDKGKKEITEENFPEEWGIRNRQWACGDSYSKLIKMKTSHFPRIGECLWADAVIALAMGLDPRADGEWTESTLKITRIVISEDMHTLIYAEYE